MKITLKNFILFFLILINRIYPHVFLIKQKPKNIFVRVLLEKYNSNHANKIKIESSDSPFYLETPYQAKKMVVYDKSINLLVENNQIKIPIKKNNKKILKTFNLNELTISTKDGSLKINGIPYQGKIILKIAHKENSLFLINKLQLDDYIYSVLVSEIYQTWPHEMQKVQAIISRTYAIYHMKQNKNRTKKFPYDIKKSNFHQRYNGFHNFKHLKEAIEETKGVIVTHNNKIALTMFDACCGGVIPSKIDFLDFNKAPYLAREKACNFCKQYSLYDWKKETTINEFMQKLQTNNNINSKLKNCGKLLRLSINKKDEAGIIKEIKLTCSKKNIFISGEQVWNSMKNKILSLNFLIKKTGNKIIINGKGFGHQIGLCQRGARELVKRGWNYKSIINFYYPGINFSRLKYAKI